MPILVPSLYLFFKFFITTTITEKNVISPQKEARQDQAVVVKKLFESRARAEDDAASARTPRNRLHVSSLVALLKERQNLVIGGGGDGGAMAVAAAAAAEQLGEKYGMDVERLQRLVRSVNVPSVREGGGGVGSVRRYVKDAESGEDMVVTEVSLFYVPFLSFFLGGLVRTIRSDVFLLQVAWKEPTVLREDLQVRPSSSRTGSA